MLKAAEKAFASSIGAGLKLGPSCLNLSKNGAQVEQYASPSVSMSFQQKLADYRPESGTGE
jgi:hypothetical protein